MVFDNPELIKKVRQYLKQKKGLTAETEDYIRYVLSEYKRPAIVLERPYPVPVDLDVRSKFGGLPQLPNEYDWPIGYTQFPEVADVHHVPMHFLAQIDCSELPDVIPEMPKTGVLFFFALLVDGGNMDAENPQDDIRVIYVPELARDTPLRAPPDHIQLIDGRPIDHYSVGYLCANPLDQRILPEWPIRLHGFESNRLNFDWQTYSAELEKIAIDFGIDINAFDIESDQQVFRGFEDAFECTYEHFLEETDKAQLNKIFSYFDTSVPAERNGFNLPNIEMMLSNPKFPENYGFIFALGSSIAQVVKVEKAYEFRNCRDNDEIINKLKAIYPEAVQWMAIAKEKELHRKTEPEDKVHFVKWFEGLVNFGGELQPGEYDKSDDPFRFKIRCAVFNGLRYLMRIAATDRWIWKHIEQKYIVTVNRANVTRCTFWQRHQMFGHIPSGNSQTDGEDLRQPLLVLCWDEDINFDFGGGELQFLISPDDLRNRRFEKTEVFLAL